MDLRPINSWTLKDEEVSAVELLEVLVINAAAPFLLTSRLKPLMARGAQNDTVRGRFVIQIASTEGQFGGKAKSTRHPHTNMAKAALNMMTRTCAREYARLGIFMNSVDPGWVSFQHPHPEQVAMRARGDTPPYDALDAAARVCDPIYTALAGGEPVWGRILKDFEETSW